MSHQTTAWSARPTASSERVAHRPVIAPTRLAFGLLLVASALLLALAGASAWLSYHAQVAYVLAHNGHRPSEARVWAFLLDAGTAGVSLLRLYETLHQRIGVATRISLLGCIVASVTMNLLHTASEAPGGYLVAAVPPVMYAVFLEHLLANLRSLLIGDEHRRSMWRTPALWINFPTLMWCAQRSSLRREAEGTIAVLKANDADRGDVSCASMGESEEAERTGGGEAAPVQAQPARRGWGPGVKRLAFEAALANQVSSGDLRLFSENERERNAAAYQAAASLPAPLSRGAARRYVVQALPRLEAASAGANCRSFRVVPQAG